jgi:anti-sigma regulatory factor (Ser/Thr protein kinase)
MMVMAKDVRVQRWRMRLPAAPETAGLLRSEMRRWLELLEWPDDAALDILLAVNEAVSNSVEHAFTDTRPAERIVEVTAAVQQVDRHRRVEAWVRDNGRWLPRPGPEPYVNRRRGLPMMYAVMEQVTIHRGNPQPVPVGLGVPAAGEASAEGTVVILLSPAAPVLVR